MTMFTETAIPARERSKPADAEDFSPGIEAIFPDQFQERDCVVETTGDKLPDFLRGTCYLNGPARFGFGDDLSYGHWLDGDGMVSSLQFEENVIRLKSRYVRSRKFQEEQNAGQPRFRAFGTSFPGDQLNRARNPPAIISRANCAVGISHSGKIGVSPDSAN